MILNSSLKFRNLNSNRRLFRGSSKFRREYGVSRTLVVVTEMMKELPVQVVDKPGDSVTKLTVK